MVPLLRKLRNSCVCDLKSRLLDCLYKQRYEKTFLRIVRQHNCGRNEKRERKVEMANKWKQQETLKSIMKWKC